MQRLYLCVGLLLLLMACGDSQLEREYEISYYKATQSVLYATAPAPIEGDFRPDSGNRARSPFLTHPLLIFVYTDFCGTCQALRPHIAALEEKYWGRIEFIYLDRADAKENYEALLNYDIRWQPELLLIRPDLEVIQRWKGAPPLEEVEAALLAILAN